MTEKGFTRFAVTRLALLLAFSAVIGAAVVTADADTRKKDRNADEITVIFTHDMHSHMEKFPKVSSVFKTERKSGDAVFLLDGGDFSMGTPYHTIYKRHAAELRMMGSMDYDATTLGNHEFDFRSRGVTEMLNSAIKSGDKLPQMVISNIDWDATLGDDKLKEDGQNLKSALEEYGYHGRYTVIERNGVRMAVFGIFGKEADSFAPESGTEFADPVETARSVVDEINNREDGIDMIVCLSHSGTYPDDPENSEDEILAEKVEGIDLIVSGHSHTYMDEPVINEKTGTAIVSCGQYNENIGIIKFKRDGNDGAGGEHYSYFSYEQKPLDKSVVDDKQTADRVQAFKRLVDKDFFSKYGFKWDQKLAENDINFTPIETFGLEQGEDALGNIIADSYIYGVMNAEGEDYEKVDVAVAPLGIIRASLSEGDITAADAFNVLSIGTGKDGVAGYPLVSVYLTGEELKLVAEVDITVSEMMAPARLYISGLVYKYNPNRLPLNKAYDISLADVYNAKGEALKEEEIENDKLYRVVADLYSAQMLGMVNDMSKGVLALVPKDKAGNPIDNYEDFIILNNDGSELKEWYALAAYIDQFDGDKIPKKYAEPEGRKLKVDSLSPGELFTDTNKYFRLIVGGAAAAVLLVILLIRYIRRRMRMKRTVYGKHAAKA